MEPRWEPMWAVQFAASMYDKHGYVDDFVVISFDGGHMSFQLPSSYNPEFMAMTIKAMCVCYKADRYIVCTQRGQDLVVDHAMHSGYGQLVYRLDFGDFASAGMESPFFNILPSKAEYYRHSEGSSESFIVEALSHLNIEMSFQQ